MDRPYVRIREYAERYSVAPKTVRKWIAAGLVEARQIGRLIRVRNLPPIGTSA